MTNPTTNNSDPTGAWVLFATISASSMVFIGQSALNVALPTIQSALGASGADLLWIVNIFALLLGALILVGGSLGDRYGRKRIYALGIGIFGLASLACGLAPSAGLLIAARALQGIGGALMVPGSLAIISAYFDGKARGQAIGTWSAFTTVTSILGPALGGILADIGWWRGVFLVNLLTLLLYGALSGALFFQPLNLVQIQGYSQTLAGFALLPWTLLLILLSRRMGAYVEEHGPRRPLILGPFIVGTSMLLLAIPGVTNGFQDYWYAYLPALLLFGLGMGLVVAPLTTTVLGCVPKHNSGINNAASRVASPLTVAILGSLALIIFSGGLQSRTAGLGLSPAAQAELQQASGDFANARPPQGLSAGQSVAVETAIRSAFVASFRLTMIICALIAWMSALLAALYIQDEMRVDPVLQT